MTGNGCPSDADLTAFNLGELAESAVDAVAAHVEACARCEERLQALDRVSDGVITSLRGLSGGPTTVTGPRTLPVAVGEYDILEELGRGGLGVVFRARHRRLGREAAVKMLLGGQFADADYRQRFEAETRAVAALRHPNIVPLFEVGEHQGQPYFAMELVTGGSLSARLAGQPQPPDQAARWLAALARAVHYAHEHKIVHRDLKPSNVLLTEDGQPKVCDFGVAKHLDGSDLRTRSGQLVGTPEYMAPEQAAGRAQDVGPAADVYSLGALLYVLLTGRPPFQGAAVLDTLEQVRTREPLPPSRLQPGVPRDLTTICLKCLEKEPHRRYASAAALADDLERFRAGQTIQARPTGAVERGWKWARRRPALAALLAVLVLVTFGGTPLLVGLLLRTERARAEAVGARHETEQALYASYVKLAQAALQADDVAEAVAWLDRCAELPDFARLAGWEHDYLRRQCAVELAPGRSHADSEGHWVFAVAYYPDGRLLSGSGPAAPDRGRQGGVVKLWDPQAGPRPVAEAEQEGGVRAVAVSPDGRRVATGCAAGEVVLRDPDTLAIRERMHPPTREPVLALVFAPDGRRLAVATPTTVRLWDPERGVCWDRPLANAASPVSLAFRPDGGQLAVATSQHFGLGPLKVWATETGAEVPHRLPEKYYCGVGFVREYLPLPQAGRLPLPVLLPRWRLVAVSRFLFDPRVQVWEADTGRQRDGLWRHGGTVTGAVVGPRGWLATAGDDRVVRLWNLDSGSPGPAYRGHRLGVASLAFAPDGHRLASGGKDGTVRVWDLTRDPRLVSFRPFPTHLGEWLGHLSFTPDSAALLVAGQGNPEPAADAGPASTPTPDQGRPGFYLQTHDPVDGARGRALPLQLTPGPLREAPNRRFAFSADGRHVAAADQNGTDPRVVKVWDAATGRPLVALRTGRLSVVSPALSGDGGRLAYAGVPAGASGGSEAVALIGAGASELHVHDVGADRPLCSVAVPARLRSPPTLSRDGRLLAAAAVPDSAGTDAPAEVFVWDAATGAQRHRLPAPHDRTGVVYALAFDPDGRRLAAAGPSNVVCLWDLARPEPLVALLPGPGFLTTGVTFSPDGRRLAAAGRDGRVKLWDASTGHELLTLQGAGKPGTGHYGFTARVVFSPDGHSLAANDWDGTVTVWNGAPRQRGR